MRGGEYRIFALILVLNTLGLFVRYLLDCGNVFIHFLVKELIDFLLKVIFDLSFLVQIDTTLRLHQILRGSLVLVNVIDHH